MNMKFTVTKGILQEALTIAGRAIANKNVMPILDNYKFVFNKAELEITGSNMELFLKTKIEVLSEIGHLSICVPAARLMSIIKDLPNQPLNFEINEKEMPAKQGETLGYMVRTLTIKAGKGIYSMPVEDGENYPEVKSGEGFQFEVPSAQLLRGIDQTLFASKQDDTGSALSGVLFSLGKSDVTYVGCNGHVLSTITNTLTTDQAKDFILPGRVLAILQGLPMDASLKISLDDRNMKIQVTEETVMEFVLVDARYPDYEGVIPTGQDKFLLVNKSELTGALKRVSNFTNHVTNSVKMEMVKDKITLTATNEDFGEDATEDVSCDYEGEDFEIGFNSKFLLSVLNKIGSDELYMSFSTRNRAFLIRESKEFDKPKQNLFLIMPIMI